MKLLRNIIPLVVVIPQVDDAHIFLRCPLVRSIADAEVGKCSLCRHTGASEAFYTNVSESMPSVDAFI